MRLTAASRLDEAVVADVVDDALRELVVDRHQREAAAHHAGEVRARLAEREHGHGGDLARGLQPGIADVPDQERVVALAHGRLHVLEHLAGLQVVEVVELRGRAADLRDAVHVDLGAGIPDRVEDARSAALYSPQAFWRDMLWYQSLTRRLPVFEDQNGR